MTLATDLRHSRAAPEGDHNPLFGSPLNTTSPVFELDAWAIRHRVPTLTHNLWLAISSPERGLFSHAFKFLVQADTQQHFGEFVTWLWAALATKSHWKTSRMRSTS